MVLTIEGMSDDGSVDSVRRVIKSVLGREVKSVEFSSGKVIVEADSLEIVENLEEKLSAKGYRIIKVESY
jgi:copper chaperone CopZ